MGSFSRHVLDKYLAPRVSEFTSAEVPDLSGTSKRWLDNHFLNSVLRGAYRGEFRPYVFNFLRRVEAAFKSHVEASTAAERFLQGSRQSMSAYMDALLHWEAYLAQAWMAYELLVRLFQTKVFKKGDGSVEQRLHALYSQSKHADSVIHNGKLPPDGTVVVWLENQGLKSEDTLVSWNETGEILKDLAKWANVLEDPIEAKNKIRSEVGDAEPD